MQQQQPNEMSPPLPLNLTTEQIQKLLDENKQLIVAIMEYQSQGRAAESIAYQNQLQNNLTFLAKIADNQAPSKTPQGPSSQTPQQEEPNSHPSQPATSLQHQEQQGFLRPRLSNFPLNEQQQLQLSYMQQQQLQQTQMGMRTAAAPTGLFHGMGSGQVTNFMNAPGGSRQDGAEGGR